ncbi:MAG: flavodoxin family protein [Deltaproteobacteria bacterium]|nr:flavodoxin family protein [Deltaproteobacteria bacterium]
MKILALCGSMRSKAENSPFIRELVNSSSNLDDYIERVKSFDDKKRRLCNSEILAGAGLCGAKNSGAKIRYYPLIDLFPRKDKKIYEFKGPSEFKEAFFMDTLDVKKDQLSELLEAIARADGIILSTPVYFGDRSSVANKLLQITGIRGLLKNKIFGIMSVGAKRNGGQETANIYSLFEALKQDALIVGNGPPTSQYGGTAVAGDMGQILEDRWGLETAFGTGARVAQVAGIFREGRRSRAIDKVKILILITIDTHDRLLKNYLEKIIEKVGQELPWVEFEMIELIRGTIYRCLGCSKCPVLISGKEGEDKTRHGCVIKDPSDFMEMVRDALNNCNGALVAGLNIHQSEEMIFRYQVFIERMRFMRRNHFELTNLLVSGLCYNQTGAIVNPIHSLKTVTSFIRHNTIIHRPVEIIEHKGEVIKTGEDEFVRFCKSANRLAAGRLMVPQVEALYQAQGEGGYKIF